MKIKLILEKETAGTYMYKEIPKRGMVPVIRNLYVSKAWLSDPSNPPREILVDVDLGDVPNLGKT